VAEWETAPSKTSDGWEEAPARFSETLKDKLGTVERRDKGIDYATGVPNAAFRAGFSRMSSDEERANWLDVNVGKGTWGKDSFGAYFLQPEGAAKFGVKVDKPSPVASASAWPLRGSEPCLDWRWQAQALRAARR
jgi:hypothetical protein